jgi:hypothetical protein
VRIALGWVTKVCVAMLAVVFLFTVFFVWAFGHPVAWSVVGVLFALLPLTGLILAYAVGMRAAVAASPGRIAVRFLGRWRIVDLGQVRAVHVGDGSSFGGFGFRFGGAGPGFGPGPGLSGGGDGVGGGAGGGAGGRTLVFEDVDGQRVEIGVDALDAGLAAVVRDGLAPDAVIDVDAARALGRGTGSDDRGTGSDAIDAGADGGADDGGPAAPGQGIGHRP